MIAPWWLAGMWVINPVQVLLMELCRGAIFSLFYIKKWGEASWRLRLTCKQTGCHWHGTILQLWLSKLQMSTRWQCLNLSHYKEVEMHRPSVNTAEKERGARNSRSSEEMYANNNKCSSGYWAGWWGQEVTDPESAALEAETPAGGGRWERLCRVSLMH